MCALVTGVQTCALPIYRAFIENLAAASSLRAFARETGGSLKDAFNAAIQAVAEFRTMHLRFAATYIANQAPAGAGNDPNVGTGGTPFLKYLKKRSEEHTSELQSLMTKSYAVFRLENKKQQ